MKISQISPQINGQSFFITRSKFYFVGPSSALVTAVVPSDEWLSKQKVISVSFIVC
jgi:hypothetical protein